MHKQRKIDLKLFLLLRKENKIQLRPIMQMKHCKSFLLVSQKRMFLEDVIVIQKKEQYSLKISKEVFKIVTRRLFLKTTTQTGERKRRR